MGPETSDDAGVYRISPECALVETSDIITPLVDTIDIGHNTLTNALFGGVLVGIAGGIVMRAGATQGGTSDVNVDSDYIAPAGMPPQDAIDLGLPSVGQDPEREESDEQETQDDERERGERGSDCVLESGVHLGSSFFWLSGVGAAFSRRAARVRRCRVGKRGGWR